MTLIDTNILVDVLTSDPVWLRWSADQLDQRRNAGSLYINGITYAEIAVRIEAEADLQAALTDLGIRLERTPVSALFMAGDGIDWPEVRDLPFCPIFSSELMPRSPGGRSSLAMCGATEPIFPKWS